MTQPQVLLEHRCCLKSEGRYLMTVAGVLAVGSAALGALLWATESAGPGLPVEVIPFALVCVTGAVAIVAILVAAFAGVGYCLHRTGGEFVCRLDRDTLEQTDPAGYFGFRMAVADIVCIEQRRGDEGRRTWFVWSRSGARGQISAFDNPVEDVGDLIRQLRPDVQVAETCDDRPWSPPTQAPSPRRSIG